MKQIIQLIQIKKHYNENMSANDISSDSSAAPKRSIFADARSNPATVNMGMRWKTEDIESISSSIEHNQSLDDIASNLKRTSSSIKSKVLSMLCENLYKGESGTAQMMREWSNRHECGFTDSMIEAHVKRLGQPKGRKSKSKAPASDESKEEDAITLRKLYDMLQELKDIQTNQMSSLTSLQ